MRLTPAGGADRLEGLARDADGALMLKARVCAAPENGEANAALEALIAKAMRRPKSTVKVARGARSRTKWVAVDGASAAEIDAFLAQFGESP